MASVLEFRIDENYFAIEMKYVKTLFEIEKVKKIPALPDYVLGLVEHNNQVYPLISLKKAWYKKDDNWKNKNAFVLVLRNGEFAILIDEIIKITDAQKTENEFLEIYKDNDELIGSLDLNFLKSLKLPTFQNKKINYFKNLKISSDNNYLLFFLGDKIYGIDTNLIKKTEDIVADDEIVKIDKQIVKVLKLKEILNTDAKESNLIILKNNKKILGLNVGDIIDIKGVNKEDIFTANAKMFNKFFIYKDKEVKVFNNEFLKELIDKEGVSEKEENKRVSKKIALLLFKIGNEKFAVRMKYVADLKDIEDVVICHTYSNDIIKGLISTKFGAVYLISYENILNDSAINPTKILILKNEVAKALLIDEILDLISVDEEKIILTNSNDYFIGGEVLLDNEMISLINLNWPTKEYLNAYKT